MNYLPMLASSGSEDDLSNGWAFEPKLDGIRCIAYIIQGKGVGLYSRTGKDITASFPDVVEQLSPLCVTTIGQTVLDGEILAAATPDNLSLVKAKLQDLQPRLGRLAKNVDLSIPALFIAYDILELHNQELVAQTYTVRRAALTLLAVKNQGLYVTPPTNNAYTVRGTYKWLVEQGAEGMIAKHPSSIYEPGSRTKNWLKIKPIKTIDCYAIGYTYGYGRRDKFFGSLVLLDTNYVYIGLVGTGFDDATLAELKAKIDAGHPHTTQEHLQATPMKIFTQIEKWCAPIKVKVQYAERTKDGMLQFPSYVGLV